MFEFWKLYLGVTDAIRRFRPVKSPETVLYSRNEFARVNAVSWRHGRIEQEVFVGATRQIRSRCRSP
ncbi:hypothetical protein WJ63_30055 [Burkholderia pyrrocinia]|nr:hypothetical protein WJ63_30055 [Burkholderia pyrrocinia]